MSDTKLNVENTTPVPDDRPTRKWTKEGLQKLLNDGKAHLVPANWTKSESWQAFKCVNINGQVGITL